MMSKTDREPTFWSTVRLLLAATRKRTAGRRLRQQQLLNNRAGKSTTDWSFFGTGFAVLLMLLINGMAAFGVYTAVKAGERMGAERGGKIVVSQEFLNAVQWYEEVSRSRGRTALNPDGSNPGAPDDLHVPVDPDVVEGNLNAMYASEAGRKAEREGGDKKAIEQKLRSTVQTVGSKAFISEKHVVTGFKVFRTSPVAAMLGSLVLLWWAVMLVCQGEGLEMDLQRRRHPMWEWIFSHPVPAGAVFVAEIVGPIAANPIYWCAPLFPAILYGFIYGFPLGLLAAFVIGIPLATAAACMSKALEIGVLLRCAPRSRGAILGILSWFGYASMMALFLGGYLLPQLTAVAARLLSPLAVLPWPWLGLFLGAVPGGGFSFPFGVLICWTVAGLTLAAAVWFCVWGAKQGLAGNFSAAESRLSRSKVPAKRFGSEPLYRKEFLWFIRDRSAIVQVILIPITAASFQLFNLRGILASAQGAWNYLCGVAIFFGTYFLWVLGPKSLQSEGTALWIALTWPRGLESLLKAKAWLWSLISTSLVALILSYAVFSYPAAWWKIVLVGVAWFFFGRSMAEKAVTLVTVTSESGETQKIPGGRRWATQLGMLTFGVGVLTQQWHIAVMGIVYSYITAAAMWQNFRARLPYLYDPWAERVPPPPTLMHAMISISILVEAGAILTGIISAIAGREYAGVAMAASYGICAIAVSIGVSEFLNNRGVSPRQVWNWLPDENAEAAEETEEILTAERPKFGWGRFFREFQLLWPFLVLGAVGGLVLGVFAHGYLAVLHQIPFVAEMMRKSEEAMAKVPDFKAWYGFMAIAFAPFAEEYLFRGLLFRALDREWGGWRAVLGSAAFFAIYHPPLAWLPVGLLGAANCILFKKTGRLAPAVVLHMVYNTVVTLT